MNKDGAVAAAVIMTDMARENIKSKVDSVFKKGELPGLVLLCLYFLGMISLLIFRDVEGAQWMIKGVLYLLVAVSFLFPVVFLVLVASSVAYYFLKKKEMQESDLMARVAMEENFLKRLDGFSISELQHGFMAFKGRGRMLRGRARAIAGSVEKIGLFPMILGLIVSWSEVFGGDGVDQVLGDGFKLVILVVMVFATICYAISFVRSDIDERESLVEELVRGLIAKKEHHV